MRLKTFERYIPTWAHEPEDLPKPEVTPEDIDRMMRPPDPAHVMCITSFAAGAKKFSPSLNISELASRNSFETS